MNLGGLLTENEEHERLHLITQEYTVESGGRKMAEPIVHLICRDESLQRRVIEVEGFRPSFYISLDEFLAKFGAVTTERRIVAIGVPDLPDQPLEIENSLKGETKVFIEEDGGKESLEGEPMVRLYLKSPSEVSELRDFFTTTWEADIPFTKRFLIDTGIINGIEIPQGATRVRWENWPWHSESEGYKRDIHPCDPPDAPAHLLTFDIEVETQGEGVPDPSRAKKPINAIAAHDSYTNEYVGWILRSPEWSFREGIQSLGAMFEEECSERIDIDSEIRAFSDESRMVEDFVQWVADRDFDMATGWNVDGFDIPYVIKRSYNLSKFNIRDWSPFREMQVWPGNQEGTARFRTKGLVVFDMLTGYKKTQWQKLRSYSLAFISERELGTEQAKLEVESYDDAWHQEPFLFMAYNLRDTQAVIEIEGAKDVIDLHDNLRAVTGAGYEDLSTNNFMMIDMLFLRQATEECLALPTNTPPETGKYHGAFVFDPVPGRHENVVYPDLASLYPYIMLTLNMSPETLFVEREEYLEAGYTDDQMYTAYNDKRGFLTVPKGETVGKVDWDKYKGVLDEQGRLRDPPGMDDPRFDEIHFVKPTVKEGFISKTIKKMVDMKYEYKDTDMYDAVKRVVNSLYGVMGDSDTGGKGFRLFNVHIAEAITLAGQKVVKYTGKMYVEHINAQHPEAGAYIVGGDTDSVQTSVPGAPTMSDVLVWAQEASQAFLPDASGAPGYYDTFAEEEFNIIHGEDEHWFEVEVESIGRALFFQRDFDEDHEVGVKKRYCQDIVWSDKAGGRWLLTEEEVEKYGIDLSDYDHIPTTPEDRIGIKGFECKRSDSALITKDVQLDVLTAIVVEDEPGDAQDRIEGILRETYDAVYDGTYPIERLGRPQGINQPLDEYGRDSETGDWRTTPGPLYKGAKYADVWFPWEDLGVESKPTRFYVERVQPNTGYPETYQYEKDGIAYYDTTAPEIDTLVEAIAVDETERIPEEFVLDVDKMLEKEVEKKVRPLVETMGFSWDEIMTGESQASLFDF